jgi:hypothetical protein
MAARRTAAYRAQTRRAAIRRTAAYPGQARRTAGCLTAARTAGYRTAARTVGYRTAARTVGYRTAGCLTAGCLTAPRYLGASTGCQTAAGFRPERTASTAPRHRIRRTQHLAGIIDLRLPRSPCPQLRTRSATSGGGRPRLSMPHLQVPSLQARRSLALRLQAAQPRAVLRQVLRDLTARPGPRGVPGSRRRVSILVR